MNGVAIVVLVAVMCVGVRGEAQSRFSIDGTNIRLETAPQKGATEDRRQAEKKADSIVSRMFKDFRAGSCRASAAPPVPSSTWPARGDAAVTACRP